LQEAAKTLGVCVTYFKKTCRELGVKRWPYRQLQATRPEYLMKKRATRTLNTKTPKVKTEDRSLPTPDSSYDSIASMIDNDHMGEEGVSNDQDIGSMDQWNLDEMSEWDDLFGPITHKAQPSKVDRPAEASKPGAPFKTAVGKESPAVSHPELEARSTEFSTTPALVVHAPSVSCTMRIPTPPPGWNPTRMDPYEVHLRGGLVVLKRNGVLFSCTRRGTNGLKASWR